MRRERGCGRAVKRAEQGADTPCRTQPCIDQCCQSPERARCPRPLNETAGRKPMILASHLHHLHNSRGQAAMPGNYGPNFTLPAKCLEGGWLRSKFPYPTDLSRSKVQTEAFHNASHLHRAYPFTRSFSPSSEMTQRGGIKGTHRSTESSYIIPPNLPAKGNDRNVAMDVMEFLVTEAEETVLATQFLATLEMLALIFR